jgi:hypothetical protein
MMRGDAMQAVEALRSNDMALMGKLMYESHASLRDDYEVSHLPIFIRLVAAWLCVEDVLWWWCHPSHLLLFGTSSSDSLISWWYRPIRADEEV